MTGPVLVGRQRSAPETLRGSWQRQETSWRQRLRELVQERFGVKYHITHVRKRMHGAGLTAKAARRVHINRATIAEIRRWQRNAWRRIPRLESRGFTVVIFDEAIFIDDPARGVKYWSPKDEPIVTRYKGRHDRVVAYGALSTDGRRFFRTYDKFNKETVLRYLRELTRHLEGPP